MLDGIPSGPSVYECFNVLIALEIFCTLNSTLVISQGGTVIGSESSNNFSLVSEEQKCSLNNSVASFGSSYTCLSLMNMLPLDLER
ncbi:unnamed protein product [Schistosoma mattheei]|uniref:Uncharacterized protein n=1 Tax=Schistosoma mattheei TaxID=31246 RepID=A0A183NQG1_9TREM|nr:unnamed protein product [Schistosoma mattheei]